MITPFCFLKESILVGKKIKEYRDRKGFSRSELGAICGFRGDGESVIAMLEREEGFPDLDKLKKVAEALSVPLEILCPVPCRKCPYMEKEKKKQEEMKI